MVEYSPSLRKLIDELKRMPGIGPKSAQRIAFHILAAEKNEVIDLAKSIIDAKENVRNCSVCYNLTDKEVCEICSDASRDQSIICVVGEPKDMIALEKTRKFKGLYHILGGVISPLDGLGPESLRIKELLPRVQAGVTEMLLAINPTTEGEATVMYLTRLLSPLGVKLTRLAYGLPVGADLDYADEMTISLALEGRRELSNA